MTKPIFLIVAKALVDISPIKNDPYANLFPPLKEIRQVSRHIAVAKEIICAELTEMQDVDEAKIVALIDNYM